MSSVVKENRARRILAELPFIPAASNWFKLLLSLLAEPLMFISSLYIIAVTVLPGSANWPPFLTNGTKTVMSIAPEIILPGCFQQAQIAARVGNKRKAGFLYALACLFIGLTLLTLASFVWNFSAMISGITLFIRCGSGLAYTIILQVSAQSGVDETMVPAVNIYEILDTLSRSQRLTNEKIHENERAINEKFESLLGFHSSSIESMKDAFISEIEATKNDLQNTFNQQNESFISTVSSDLHLQIEATKNDLHLQQNERIEDLKIGLQSEFANILTAIEGRLSSPKTTIVTQIEASKPVTKIIQPVKRLEAGNFDRRNFVYSSLEEDDTLTVAQLITLAKEQGNKLSTGSASQYRNAFRSGEMKASFSENESGIEEENESFISEIDAENERQNESFISPDKEENESFILEDTGEIEALQLAQNESVQTGENESEMKA